MRFETLEELLGAWWQAEADDDERLFFVLWADGTDGGGGQAGRSWGAAEDGVPDEGAEVVGVRAWCPELGLSTDDMCLLAYLWREGADDQDVAEELLRQWGGSADDRY